MANCTSTFADADYGCSGGNGSVKTIFSAVPMSLTHSESGPSIGVVNVQYSNEIEIDNVKYSSTDGQDISAWQVFTSSQIPLGSTNKTFCQKQDCAPTTSTISGLVQVPIMDDTLIRFGGRWSGLGGNGDTEEVAGDCEWYDVELGQNFIITPPQDLQVTFGAQTAQASISSWSTNPNITGAVQEDGYGWNWKIETINTKNEVVGVQEYNQNSLTAQLVPDLSALKPLENYTLKAIVSNEYQRTVSVVSPQLATGAPDPITRRVRFEPDGSGTYTMYVDWALPATGGSDTITMSITVSGTGGSTSTATLATVSNGASQSGTYTVTGVQSAKRVKVTIDVDSRLSSVQNIRYYYSPVEAPQLSYNWDTSHRCVTVTAESPNVTNFDMKLGYIRDDDSLGSSNSGNSLQVCDLDHGAGQILYASATPLITDVDTSNSTGYATIPILNPILGVTNDCTDKKNIVDIVECKGGELTPRWQNGQRVLKKSQCVAGTTVGEVGAEYNVLMSTTNPIRGTVELVQNGYIMYDFVYPNQKVTLPTNAAQWPTSYISYGKADSSTRKWYIDFSGLVAGKRYDMWIETVSGTPPTPYGVLQLGFYTPSGSAQNSSFHLLTNGAKTRGMVPSFGTIYLVWETGTVGNTSNYIPAGYNRNDLVKWRQGSGFITGNQWTFTLRYEQV